MLATCVHEHFPAAFAACGFTFASLIAARLLYLFITFVVERSLTHVGAEGLYT